MNFKGFEDWIEVFSGGKQTDSAGVEHDGDAVMERALATFDPAHHEPPLVVGHPKNNAPAFGWVAGLKLEDGKLLARFKDVNPDFAAMVEAGLYKKRSISVYPDGRLRHVGFLGAAAPAVKGLRDVAFSTGDDAAVFVSQITCKNEEKNGMGDFDWTKFWQGMFSGSAQAGNSAPAAPAAGPGHGDAGKSQFTEADIAAARQQAADEAKKKTASEFAEKQRQEASDARKQEIGEFCDTLVSEGQMPPAMAKSGGLAEFCAALAEMEPEIEFSEGGKTEKVHPAKWFMEFMGGLAESRIFSEVATKGKAGEGKDKEVNFSEAFKNKI